MVSLDKIIGEIALNLHYLGITEAQQLLNPKIYLHCFKILKYNINETKYIYKREHIISPRAIEI